MEQSENPLLNLSFARVKHSFMKPDSSKPMVFDDAGNMIETDGYRIVEIGLKDGRGYDFYIYKLGGKWFPNHAEAPNGCVMCRKRRCACYKPILEELFEIVCGVDPTAIDLPRKRSRVDVSQKIEPAYKIYLFGSEELEDYITSWFEQEIGAAASATVSFDAGNYVSVFVEWEEGEPEAIEAAERAMAAKGIAHLESTRAILSAAIGAKVEKWEGEEFERTVRIFAEPDEADDPEELVILSGEEPEKPKRGFAQVNETPQYFKMDWTACKITEGEFEDGVKEWFREECGLDVEFSVYYWDPDDIELPTFMLSIDEDKTSARAFKEIEKRYGNPEDAREFTDNVLCGMLNASKVKRIWDMDNEDLHILAKPKKA